MEYGSDYFNQLRSKVQELKQRRDHLNQDLQRDATTLSHVEDQIAQLDRERQKLRLDMESKKSQAQKFNDLIDTSEQALNKMVDNTKKLDATLSNALSNPRGL